MPAIAGIHGFLLREKVEDTRTRPSAAPDITERRDLSFAYVAFLLSALADLLDLGCLRRAGQNVKAGDQGEFLVADRLGKDGMGRIHGLD